MTVKFVKNASAVPVHVYAQGYGWQSKDGKDTREGFVSIVTGEQTITIDAADVPALVKALEQGLVESNKMIDAELARSRKHFAAFSSGSVE